MERRTATTFPSATAEATCTGLVSTSHAVANETTELVMPMAALI
jgi:hypothetical protein